MTSAVPSKGVAQSLLVPALLGALYWLAAHWSSVQPQVTVWAVWLASVPLGAAALLFSWPTRLRWLALLLVMVLAWQMSLHLQWWTQHIAALWFVQHVGAYSLLAALFGRSLLPGREPLATQVARAVLPTMPSQVLQYTRYVTCAWTIFFLLVVLISALLFSVAPVTWWSAFANLICGPLVLLMFVVEYLLRRRLLPPSHCATLAQTIVGFRRLYLHPKN